jgi:hypothetical protein
MSMQEAMGFIIASVLTAHILAPLAKSVGNQMSNRPHPGHMSLPQQM